MNQIYYSIIADLKLLKNNLARKIYLKISKYFNRNVEYKKIILRLNSTNHKNVNAYKLESFQNKNKKFFLPK